MEESGGAVTEGGGPRPDSYGSGSSPKMDKGKAGPPTNAASFAVSTPLSMDKAPSTGAPNATGASASSPLENAKRGDTARETLIRVNRSSQPAPPHSGSLHATPALQSSKQAMAVNARNSQQLPPAQRDPGDRGPTEALDSSPGSPSSALPTTAAARASSLLQTRASSAAASAATLQPAAATSSSALSSLSLTASSPAPNAALYLGTAAERITPRVMQGTHLNSASSNGRTAAPRAAAEKKEEQEETAKEKTSVPVEAQSRRRTSTRQNRGINRSRRVLPGEESLAAVSYGMTQ